MTAQIHRQQTISLEYFVPELRCPGERALREAVDEEDWLATLISRLNDVNTTTATTSDEVMLKPILLGVAGHLLEVGGWYLIGGCEAEGIAAGGDSRNAA
jgi:hypothetical protein